MHHEDDLRLLAATQHGVVAVHQLSHLTPDARRWLVQSGRWERAAPRVIRLVGAPATVEQRATIAVLDGGPGAALAAASTLAWFGVPGNQLTPWQIHRVRGHVGREERDLARHESVLLPPHHLTVHRGVSTVVPSRALFEVAGTRFRGAEQPWWVERMERMVDTAWSMRLVSGASLHRMLDELAQRGRPGIRVMRQVLADRPTHYVPPASGLESRVQQILRRADLPTFRRQVDLGDDASWIGRVDFVAEGLPVVLEVQSERYHSSIVDRRHDELRIARLRRAGLEVVEIDEERVWHRPNELVDLVTAAVRRARLRSLATTTQRTRRSLRGCHPANIDRLHLGQVPAATIPS